MLRKVLVIFMKYIRMSLSVKLTLLLTFVFLIITYISLEIKYNTLEEERDQLNAKIDTVEDSIEALQNSLNTPFDEEYITKLAKEKLNYCLPDEVIFYNDLIN